MASQVETPRYESLVDDNIAQVSRKIRLADLGRGTLALACLLFGYVLLASLLDLSMGGSDAWGPLAIRLVVFAGLIFGLGVLGARIAMRYVTSVNPYYAARQLEETIPGAKNSLINWLDLKDAPLPPVIHQAVGMRAARDVAEADADLVTSSRDMWKLGGAAGILFIGLICLFAIVPRQFGSLLARAALPLRTGSLGANTTITILKPGAGDTVVPANQRVDFLARIEGSIPRANTPTAPALHYRYTTNDVAVRVPLEEDINGQWGVRLSPDQVRTGLFWKITAGDASTPEVQLRVRAQPFVTRFEATYHYRPYRKIAPVTVAMPSDETPQPQLFGHRGTDVVLKARTNAPVKAGILELDLQGTKIPIPAQLPASEPQTLVFRFTLDKSGTFRILFESPSGEPNLDRSPYAMDVLNDGAPLVVLTKPGKDLVAPANGTLLLDGVVIDDFGVTAVSLQMRRNVGQAGSLPKSQPLAAQPYKTKLKFDNGTYAAQVKYVDVLALDQLRTPDGQPIALKAGDEITYWLEATDNNDFGHANVGKSKAFKVAIQDGLQPSKEQKQQRQDAQNQKDQNDKDQGAEHDKQNQDKNQQGGSQKDDNGSEQGNNAKGGNGEQNGAKENDPSKNQQGNNGSGGNANEPPSQNEQKLQNLKNELGSTADSINEALEKNNSNKNNPSDAANGQNNSEKSQGGNEQPNPKTGAEESPKKDGNPDNGMGKTNPADADPGKKDDPKSTKKDDPKSTKKDDPKGAGEAGKGEAGKQKSGGNGSPNEGTGGAKESNKSETGKSGDDDPKSPSTGKAKDPDGGTQKPTKKTGNPDLVEKGNTPEGGKAGPPKEKSAGPSNPAKAQGNDNQDPSNGSKQTAGKKGPDDKSSDQAKGDPGKTGEPNSSKVIPPNPADVAKAKEGNIDNKQPPTKEEIDAFKDLVKKGGPAADAAAKDIVNRSQNLDPSLKKDLEKALKDAGREQDLNQLAGGNPELAPMPQEGNGQTAKGAAPKDGPPENPGNEAGPKTGPGGRGALDDHKKMTPEEAFARRMGNLQLDNIEELKKRVTPEVLKEAKISPADWQRFLDNAREYQALLSKVRDREGAKILKGGVSRIGNQGLRKIESAPNATQDTTVGAGGVPPAEFRDPQRHFTTQKSKTP
jgi:hypothetical protein